MRRGSYRSLPLTNPSPESYRVQGGVRDYELHDEEEPYPTPRRGAMSPARSAASPRRRPNGLSLSSLGPGRPTSKIVQDLETPAESVLWDEEEVEVEASGRVPVMTSMSSQDGSEIVESGSDEGDLPYTPQTLAPRYQR